MENYENWKVFGKGAQGKVYKVTHKGNKKEYVIKKIECKDESEANKAFAEAQSLQNLQHPFICGYKEFFVEWDQELSAIMVCIVMDYYPCGDLQKLMRTRRKEKKKIEEVLIKKWLGQIAEVLKFIHEKDVIHRDLKPSNLFLKDNSLDLVVGDFGVATVMGDIRTMTRSAVGSFMWMAPEVTERPYDERTDVWSVGCIFLELLTCHELDEKAITNHLSTIKSDPKVLENLFAIIEKAYPKELASIVRMMLRRNFEQRPTSEELSKLPYVMSCMALTQSSKVARAKKQEVSTKDKPVPKDKGLKAVVDYLKTEKKNEYCVAEALEWISQQPELKLDNAAKKIVAEVMTEHLVADAVCTHGTKIFRELSVKATDDDAMFTPEVLKSIIQAAKSHPRERSIQVNAIIFFLQLSVYVAAPVLLGKLGAVHCILEAMRAFPKDEELNAAACSALYSICVEESNAAMAAGEGAVMSVCSCLRTHLNSALVLEHAPTALLPLLIEDDALKEAEEQGVLPMLLSALTAFVGHTQVAKNVLMAVSTLMDAESMALLFIECQDRGSKTLLKGIPICQRIYEVHQDNVELVCVLCEVLDFFLQHKEVAVTINTSEIKSLLTAAGQKFSKDQKIQKACSSALKSLQG